MTFHNAHLSAHPFVGLGTHSSIHPPPLAPGIYPHISGSTLLGLTIKAKFSKKEFGPGGFNLMARGNDSGYFVTHVSIPATNFLLAVIIPLGSSKIMFGSSKVHIHVDGKAEHCGCCVFPIVPLSLNMSCNDPCSYPSDRVIAPNTIEVSMTLGDILMGIASAVMDVAVSFVVGKAAGGVSGSAFKTLARRHIGQQVFWELAGDLGPKLGPAVFNCMVSNITDSIGGKIVSGFVDEGIKEVMGRVINNTVDYVTGGNAENMGDFLDKSGMGMADAVGQSPSSDSRIYGTDGPGIRTGVRTDSWL